MPSAIRDPTPAWLQPGQESVFDSPITKALRMMAQLIGADDPTSQIAALANPLEAGPVGGALGAVAKLFGTPYRGAPDLYSRLERSVATLPDRPIPPGQVLSVAKKAGVKDEELAYRLQEFLAQQGTKPVTKAEVTAALQQKPIQVGVKTMGGPRKTLSEADRNELHLYQQLDRHSGMRNMTPDDWSRYRTLQEMNEAAGVDQTKFSRYQVPGGEDYRETLLTLPSGHRQESEASIIERAKQWAESSGDPWDRLGPNGRQRYIDQVQKFPAEGTFTSSHFDEPNILAHTRSNTRTLPSGEKGTFLEEVQSDWHQKGKAQGYSTGQYKSGVREDANVWVVYRPDGTFVDVPKRFAQNADEAMAYADRAPDLTRHHQTSTGVPDAPFKEAWPDLALKHHLMEAANDPETAWLGFTGGQTQAARYDLSKQISSLEYNATSRQLSAYGPNSSRVLDETVTPDKLADYVGKEAAQRLLETTPHTTARGSVIHRLEGQDLQVGGEGMHEFYDKLLPKRLEKLVKPFGGTVEQGQIPDQAGDWADQLYQGNPVTDFELAEVARARSKAPSTQPAWFARLTPEMKARIQREGFPALVAILGVETAMTPEAQALLGEAQ